MLAALGMAIAVGATLATDVIGNWPLIVAGLVAGTAVGAAVAADFALRGVVNAHCPVLDIITKPVPVELALEVQSAPAPAAQPA